MKELLIMAKSLGGGGSEVALIELMNALPEDLYNITLALLDTDDEYAYRLKKQVNIIQTEFRNPFVYSLVSMYSFPAKVLKKLSVNRYVPYYDYITNCVRSGFDKEYDIAIDFYGYGSFITAFVADKIKAKKKATWLHDENMYWLKDVERYLPAYDRVFGVSQAVVDTFCGKYPSFREKADVFYNVINISDIRKKADEHEQIPFRKDTFNILTVGRLVKQKGYDIAIGAAAILAERGINFTWYVIGCGREERKLQKLAEDTRGLENRFVFLGQKKNPYPYMKGCDLYVQPSRNEGYGLTLVEARTLCRAILASDIPAFREQIADGMNGYLAELNSVSFADKIEYLYKNPGAREKTICCLRHQSIDYSAELQKLEEI